MVTAQVGGETFELVDAGDMAARRRLGAVEAPEPKRVVRPMTARDVRRARRRLEDESGDGSYDYDDDPEYANCVRTAGRVARSTDRPPG